MLGLALAVALVGATILATAVVFVAMALFFALKESFEPSWAALLTAAIFLGVVLVFALAALIVNALGKARAQPPRGGGGGGLGYGGPPPAGPSYGAAVPPPGAPRPPPSSRRGLRTGSAIGLVVGALGVGIAVGLLSGDRRDR